MIKIGVEIVAVIITVAAILVVCVGGVGLLFIKLDKWLIPPEGDEKPKSWDDKWGNKHTLMTSQGGEEIDWIDCKSKV